MISIIIPVYNEEKYLHNCLCNILNQDYQNLEIICIDDFSTDSSLEILKHFAQKDTRVKILKNKSHQGLNFSKNKGLNNAKGDFILFLETNSRLSSNLIKKILKQSKKNQLDILLFKNCVSKKKQANFNIIEYYSVNFLDKFNSKIFNKNDLSKFMLTAILNVPLKKLYSKKFLEENNLYFLDEELPFKNNSFFYNAKKKKKKISFLDLNIITIPTNTQSIQNEFFYEKWNMLNELINETSPIISLNYSNNFNPPTLIFFRINDFEKLLIKTDLYEYLKLVFLSYKLIKLKESFDECSNFYKDSFYEKMRREFLNMKLDSTILRKFHFEIQRFYINVLNFENYKKYMKFNFYIRKENNYINKKKLSLEIENFKEVGTNETKRKETVIISLTSFPDRMKDIHFCIYSLLKQNFKPDKVILWLASEQFPHKEKDIPNKLLKLTNNGLTIKWCEDIKSYKKLIPTLREYPDNFIVQVDDDIFYPKNWLENMCNSYKKNPKTIISSRVRTIKLDKKNNIEKYDKWSLAQDFQGPSYLNFPTGAGGILYFPNALSKIVFIFYIFKKLCPTADDIWFWSMAVLNETKISGVEQPYNSLNYINIIRELGIDNSFTLWNYNKYGKNDIQLKNILNHFPEIKNRIIT